MTTELTPAADGGLSDARAVAPAAPSRVRPTWSWAQYLALVGVPLLFWNMWTEIAWLIDGPHQITQFRDHSSSNWMLTHRIEVFTALMSIVVIAYLVRGSRRARRLLTFEVMFCLVGITMHWSDYGINFFHPIFSASSNFVNLNASCGHMPGIINLDCGRAADPILFFVPMALFLIPGQVFVCNWLLGKLRARWGDPSRGQVWCAILGLSILIALLEVPILMMGVWVYAGGPMSMHLGPGIYDPVIFVESVACVAVYIGVYHFRNAQGERIVERGMAHYSSRRRKAVTLLALYTTLQLATWGPGTMPVALSSFYQHGWRKMPAYLVNALCDAPGISGTRYGPCPGSPGFRTPGRGSLPGESP